MGFLPNALKLYAHRPEIAATLWKLNSNVMRDSSSTLDQFLKRKLAAVACATNGRAYCTAHSCVMLKKPRDTAFEGWGVSEGELQELIKGDFMPKDEFERACLDYVRAASADPTSVPDDVLQRLKQHLTPPQIIELACVVGFWKFYNTVHDSLHIPVESAKKEPAAKAGPVLPLAGLELPLTVSRPALLERDSDRRFCHLVYGLLTIANRMNTAREHLGRRMQMSGPKHSLLMAIAYLQDAGGTSVGALAHALHVSSAFLASETGKASHIAAGSRIIIVGGGFIGAEVAATAREAAAEVILIEPQSVLMQNALGLEVGGRFSAIHERNGVQLLLNESAAAIRMLSEGIEVVTRGGERVTANAVLVCIGIRPNDDIASSADVERRDGIVVDQFFKTTRSEIFAAGDVAKAFYLRFSQYIRTESHESAIKQGARAAINMLGRNAPNDDVPLGVVGSVRL